MYEYNAFVTKVYDGDTITVDIDLGFGVELKKQTIRLIHINTPEVRGESKEAGYVSRDYVREKILDKTIILKTTLDKKGKYGRWLGEIIYQNELNESVNLNEELISEGLAIRYM